MGKRLNEHGVEFRSLPEDVLFEQVRTDVSPVQISDFTSWPDLLQTEDSCARDVGVLFGLDHDDETGVYRHWDRYN